MTRQCNLLLTTAMLAGLCVSGIAPASAQKSPTISPPHISPMRPDFNSRTPNSLRDQNVPSPDEAEDQKKKANRRRAVQEEDYREKAKPLPSVQRAKASKQNKKTKSVGRQGVTPGAPGIVSDKVLKAGSTISGGWREYAANLSWRRVVFKLDGQVATVVFSDGLPGGLLPAVTRFARSGPGPQGLRTTYHEVRTFPAATPGILDKANRSSPIPSDVATGIRGRGVDFRLLQQLMDDKGWLKELGSAFDAAGGPRAGAGGLLDGFPGRAPHAHDSNWSDPRSAAGGRCPGCAADDVITINKSSTDEDGNTSTIVETRHGNGSTTTTRGHSDGHGNTSTTTEHRDARGRITGGSDNNTDADGSSFSYTYDRDPNTREEHGTSEVRIRGRSAGVYYVGVDRNGVGWSIPPLRPNTPPETGGTSGGFDEAWLYRSLPWLMDAFYGQWKRESDLVTSGGRISQPGGQPTLVLNEGPEVGVSGVVNCGASDSNPCRGPAGVAVDPRGGFRTISQPPAEGGPGAPAGTGPRPRGPEPAPAPQ